MILESDLFCFIILEIIIVEKEHSDVILNKLEDKKQITGNESQRGSGNSVIN